MKIKRRRDDVDKALDREVAAEWDREMRRVEADDARRAALEVSPQESYSDAAHGV